MSNKHYYFYDLNEILIDRYPAKIANKIKDLDSKSNFIFIYSEKYNEGEPEKLPNGSKSFYIPSLSKKKIVQLIKDYPPYSLTTIAQRIPDMWILSLFNHLNINTNIVQHGLWSDKLQRVSLFSLIVQKFSKFLNYISYTKKICSLNKIPFLSTLKDLYDFLLKENKTILETRYLNIEKIRAKRVFAFDNSWNDYYTKKYGYSLNEIEYIGNPDLLLLKDKNLSIKEDSICYLCQSLVEDGRLEKEKYIRFLNKMVSYLPKSKKIYIKLHPRSRMYFYLSLKNNKNVIFTNDLPICNFYIGHYTGLLATVNQISDNILVWLFSDHHTPEYFKKFASVVTQDYETLADFMNENIEHKQNSTNFRRFSKEELDDFDPINEIAKNLKEN
tara:strand:- start:1029 stop:2186 length:1158 start_codon:yes stop_codon:yes gene_type:complete